MTRDIVIVGAARTAIGAFGGGLKDVPLSQLATIAVRAALDRSRVEPGAVGHVALGNVIPTEPKDAYLIPRRRARPGCDRARRELRWSPVARAAHP